MVSVIKSIQPLSEVTWSDTGYFPAVEKVWDTLVPVWLFPSPKFQTCELILPPNPIVVLLFKEKLFPIKHWFDGMVNVALGWGKTVIVLLRLSIQPRSDVTISLTW